MRLTVEFRIRGIDRCRYDLRLRVLHVLGNRRCGLCRSGWHVCLARLCSYQQRTASMEIERTAYELRPLYQVVYMLDWNKMDRGSCKPLFDTGHRVDYRSDARVHWYLATCALRLMESFSLFFLREIPLNITHVWVRFPVSTIQLRDLFAVWIIRETLLSYVAVFTGVRSLLWNVAHDFDRSSFYSNRALRFNFGHANLKRFL